MHQAKTNQNIKKQEMARIAIFPAASFK